MEKNEKRTQQEKEKWNRSNAEKKVSIRIEIATVRNAKCTKEGKFILETLIALSFTSTSSVTERQDNPFESECTLYEH